jgi:hypothetical protein
MSSKEFSRLLLRRSVGAENAVLHASGEACEA